MYATKVKRMKWAYLYWFASVIDAIEMIFIVASSWLLFKRHDVSDVVKEGYRVIASQFTKFSYFELKKATSNFKEELGKGASEAVFKSVLADERVVAVKILGDVHRLLVYEYVENQSLDQHLFSRNVIGWKERFKVALGTAKGLAYLHHECLEWVIHCDVKPENILLDGEFEPKILDFGLAKLSQRDRKNPEFSVSEEQKLVKGNRLSNLVLEDGEEQETELTKFLRDIKRKFKSEEVTGIEDGVDTRLSGEFNRIQVEKMNEIGISCLEEDKNRRPTMDSIVQALLECEEGARVQSNSDPHSNI
ncbi:hypothetical protein Gogos_022232 [Gossypium gossypioides]|uniref:Protein kinase domain-containing protein n=1 Tax=Gossypium gossypioides TaxID=34282 RepID=A0A7J9D702_GOSGO|nr:hypothetical protein [Gossypium gossypioides]